MNTIYWVNICFFPPPFLLHFPALDGPKHTEIMRAGEQQQPGGGSSVTLSCSSHSYPPVTHYLWYKKTKDKRKDIIVSDRQNYTVYSDEPGIYYCVARNEINKTSSDPVQLFVDREWIPGYVSACVLHIAFRTETCWRFCGIIHFFLSSLELCHLFTNLFLHCLFKPQEAL